MGNKNIIGHTGYCWGKFYLHGDFSKTLELVDFMKKSCIIEHVCITDD